MRITSTTFDLHRTEVRIGLKPGGSLSVTVDHQVREACVDDVDDALRTAQDVWGRAFEVWLREGRLDGSPRRSSVDREIAQIIWGMVRL